MTTCRITAVTKSQRGLVISALPCPTDSACERFEELGVEFQKKPNDGNMKGIVFIKDPDGYWIEIFTPNRQPDLLREHL